MRHIPSDAKKTRIFQRYDVNYKIEINFPSSLDESFGISTNKQYVNLPFKTINSDGWVHMMTEASNLYSDVKKSFQEEELNLLETARLIFPDVPSAKV